MTFQFDVKSGHRVTSGAIVASGRTRLKGGIISPASSTTVHTVFATNVVTTGTYSQTTTTITVTMTNSLTVGDRVWLDFTSGSATDAVYVIVTASSSQFTVTAASATTSGNVSLYAGILMEVDTTSATPFSFTVPGDGILAESGLYVGMPSVVSVTVFYG
jgi:hypothetical protein